MGEVLEWTNEQVIRLINSYKARGMLWDPEHDLYRVQTAKYEAWCELAELYGCEITELRKKFNSILASHRREKAKIRMGGKSSWFAYNHLSFLPNHLSYEDDSKAVMLLLTALEKKNIGECKDFVNFVLRNRVKVFAHYTDSTQTPLPISTELTEKHGNTSAWLQSDNAGDAALWWSAPRSCLFTLDSKIPLLNVKNGTEIDPMEEPTEEQGPSQEPDEEPSSDLEEYDDNGSNSPINIIIKEEPDLTSSPPRFYRTVKTSMENRINKRKLEKDKLNELVEKREKRRLLESTLLKGSEDMYKKKDECDSFGEYIAVSLRKHDERTRSMIKQAINNILFEQEMKKYNSGAGQYTVIYAGNDVNPLIVSEDCEK